MKEAKLTLGARILKDLFLEDIEKRLRAISKAYSEIHDKSEVTLDDMEDTIKEVLKGLAERDQCIIAEILKKKVLEGPPENFWHYHSADCGTKYRGCAPDCPKDIYERTGKWEVK